MVTSFFAENDVYHASVGPDALDNSYVGKNNIRRGVQDAVAGDIGTFEWDFVTTDSSGQKVRTAGCDLLQFVDDKVAVKNAFRKQRG